MFSAITAEGPAEGERRELRLLVLAFAFLVLSALAIAFRREVPSTALGMYPSATLPSTKIPSASLGTSGAGRAGPSATLPSTKLP
ncbi:MAG: hypothetical protein AABY97_01760, partial [Chloroflexota bacterium]